MDQAYRMLLEVIEASGLGGSKRSGTFVLDTNAIEAYSRIYTVVAIAKAYSAVEGLEMASVRNMNTWISNRTLLAAINEDTISWLDIGITTRKRDVFDEGFVHCVGGILSFPAGRADLHPDMKERMAAKAEELEACCRNADPKLSNLMLKIKARVSAGYEGVANVSISKDAVGWVVNGLFSDWKREHLGFFDGDDEDLDDEGDDEDVYVGGLVNQKTTATCNRKGGQCLHFGGFYRLIGKADDSYLPVSKVMNILMEWHDEAFKESEPEVRAALDRLKDLAKRIVGSLASSKLTYADVEKLEYWTRVEVEDKNVPWNEEVDEDVAMED